jgi:hypothetical protein
MSRISVLWRLLGPSFPASGLLHGPFPRPTILATNLPETAAICGLRREACAQRTLLHLFQRPVCSPILYANLQIRTRHRHIAMPSRIPHLGERSAARLPNPRPRRQHNLPPRLRSARYLHALPTSPRCPQRRPRSEAATAHSTSSLAVGRCCGSGPVISPSPFPPTLARLAGPSPSVKVVCVPSASSVRG